MTAIAGAWMGQQPVGFKATMTNPAEFLVRPWDTIPSCTGHAGQALRKDMKHMFVDTFMAEGDEGSNAFSTAQESATMDMTVHWQKRPAATKSRGGCRAERAVCALSAVARSPLAVRRSRRWHVSTIAAPS
mmetsp:Transcript_165441/g.525842  ORF Transcript_165441/g.525842 Transcript_165441/m.525842 type:complete len:131 (+) Transcript_165441:1493-1885(+)